MDAQQFVLKRNGEYQIFWDFKIKDDIHKAFDSVSENINNDGFDKVFDKVLRSIYSIPVISVEEIQDVIEKVLYELHYFNAMRSFMLYRHTRKMQRENAKGLKDDTTYIDSTHAIEEYID